MAPGKTNTDKADEAPDKAPGMATCIITIRLLFLATASAPTRAPYLPGKDSSTSLIMLTL